jgi:flagellar hook-associated protein 1 FlgK
MSGLTGAINTALSGIEAYEAGISTVSENLANASVAGYAVESVDLTTLEGALGQPGNGVAPAQITRAADGFLAGLLRTSNSAAAGAGVSATGLASISAALAGTGDVQSSINQFFTDVSSLAANPSSAAARQTVLSDAQTIAGSFQSAAGSIGETMSGATTSLQENVTSANNLLTQLAGINKSLETAPNDPNLLDQQEAALQSLSSLLPVNVLPQSNGQIIVSTGGAVLLDQSGAQALQLSGGTGTAPPVVTAGSAGTPLAASDSAGEIGANLQVWTAGNTALSGLNQLATTFAGAVNTSQAEGLTATGAAGGDLFEVPGPSVAAACGNTGSATLSAQISDASTLPADGGPFTLSFSAANGWTAVDQSSHASYPVTTTAAGALSFAGITVSVTGTPADGDQFVVNPAPGAAAGITAVAASPDDIAAADPYVATPGALQSDGSISDTNAGTITAGADSITTTPAANAAVVPASFYGQTLQVVFTSATAYNVETTSTPPTTITTGTFSGSGTIAIAYPAGAASGSYLQLPISGTPAAGDVVTLAPGGSSSASNATRMAAIWTAPGTTSSGTLQDAAVGLGTVLGSNAAQAQTTATAAAAQAEAAATNLESVSGVSTDQQAVELTNYQQAYQAAAQVISAVNTMFESLLTAV